MKCMTKKKWNGLFKWVNIDQNGKYWPIRTSGNHLNFRCKLHLEHLAQLQKSFRSLPMTIELLTNKLIRIEAFILRALTQAVLHARNRIRRCLEN